MSTTIGDYWFSEININNNFSVIDEGILEDIVDLYSENYGNWYDDNSKITLSIKKFFKLHKNETIYFISERDEGSIVAFASVTTKGGEMKVITSMCVKKEFRNRGLGTKLVSYILDRILNEGIWKIGVVSANPILLLILETHPKLKYIDLEEESSKDVSFGIKLSIFIDEFRTRSYNALSSECRSPEKISFKKIDTGFSVKIPENEIYDGLGEFYRNLMGTLEPGEEWLLFCNYESKPNNKIRQEI